MSSTNSVDSPSSLSSNPISMNNNNNNKYLPQYLHPDYLDPLAASTDSKQSPLALLAETCNNIGKDLLGSIVHDCKPNKPNINRQTSPTSMSPSKRPDNHHNSNRHHSQTPYAPDTSTSTPVSSLASSTSSSAQHSPSNSIHSPNNTANKCRQGGSPRARSRSPVSSSVRRSHKSPQPQVDHSFHTNISSPSALFGQPSAASNFLMTSLLTGGMGLASGQASLQSNQSGGGLPTSLLLNNPWGAALMAAHNAATAKTPCTDPYCPYCHVTHRPCACLQCLQQKLLTADPYTSAYLAALQHQQQMATQQQQAAVTSKVSTATAEYCIYCGKHCPSPDDLLTHMQQHLKKDSSTTIVTSTPSGLNQHSPTSPSSLMNSIFPALPSPQLSSHSTSGFDGKSLSPSAAAALMAAASRQFHQQSSTQPGLPFRPPMPSSLAAHLAYPFGAGLV